MYNRILLPTTIGVIFLLGCNPGEPYYEAPAELNVYVQKFIEEGRKRGFDLNLKEEAIALEFGKLPGNKGGKCISRGYPKRIVIDRGRWKLMNQSQQETLIYHELGHCILGRKHRNKTLPNGECASLMDGTENGFSCSNNFAAECWRDYYLDELFYEETQLPSWYQFENNYLVDDITKEYIINKTNPVYSFNKYSLTGLVDSLAIDESRDYQAEVTYDKQPSGISGLYLHWKGYELLVYFKTNEEHGSSKSLVKVSGALYRSIVDQMTFPLKLTIRKQRGFMYFYVNERLMHQTEDDTPTTEQYDLQTNLFDERYNLQTSLFDKGEADMNVNFVYLR